MPLSIVSVLMTRDKMSQEEAEERLTEVHKAWVDGGYSDDPEELCYSEFGLEPDYMEDIMYPPHHNT